MIYVINLYHRILGKVRISNKLDMGPTPKTLTRR